MKLAHKKKRPLRRAITLVLWGYLAFALLGTTLPHIAPVSVGEENKGWLGQAVSPPMEQAGTERAALLESPALAYEARLLVAAEAQSTMDIAYHTLQDGETTAAFLGEVLAAADRGVQVRILLDGKAGTLSLQTARWVRALDAHPNIECRRYNRLNPLKPWAWQSLLHDKFIVVDGRYMILGGRNLGDHYYNPYSYSGPVTNDRDVFIWQTAPTNGGISQVEDYMDLLWESPYVSRSGGQAGDRTVQKQFAALRSAARQIRQLNPHYSATSWEGLLNRTVATNSVTLLHNPIHTNKKEPWVGWQLEQLALSAKESVVLQTPYATANPMLLGALETTAQSVPSATMLTNSLASSPNYPAFSNYYSQRQKFLNTGVSIVEYQHTDSIHGKSMLVDSRISVVGSLNMDDRSLFLDTETMLLIDSPAFTRLLSEAVDDLQAQSLLVDPATNQYAVADGGPEPFSTPGGKKVLMWVFSLFSRLLQFLI